MDSASIVTQQPVSTLPDLISDIPNTHTGLSTAVVEAPYPAEPLPCLSKPEAAAALVQSELPVREAPSTLEHQEETNRTDGNGNVEKFMHSSISTEGSPLDAVSVQQIKDTVDIEVNLPAPATDAESGPHEGTVVTISNMQQEAGHLGLLVDQAYGKSNAEGIAAEVVLKDVIRPPISEAQLSPLGEDGSGSGEVPASVELTVEVVELKTGQGLSNVIGNGGIEHSEHAGNVGISLEIEAVVVSDADATAAILQVDAQGAAGAEAAGRTELDVSSITELEQGGVEVVLSDATAAGNVIIVESSAAAEAGTSIEVPQLMDNLELANPAVDIVIQLSTGDASIAEPTTKEDVRPVAVSEATLDAADHFTADASKINAPELESLEAVATLDQRVDIPTIAKEPLNAIDSAVTEMVGEGSTEDSTTAVELDVVHPSTDMKADGLVDTVIVLEEIREVSAEDCRIDGGLDVPIRPEDRGEMEDLEDLLVVTVASEAEESLNTGDPLTSNAMDISTEQSSILVQVDASSAVLLSENREAAELSIEVEEDGIGDAIPLYDESVACQCAPIDHSGDAALAATGVTEPIEEPVAVALPPQNSNDLQDTSAEKPSNMVELGSISESTSIMTTDELKEENIGNRVVGDTGEELPPIVESASLAGVSGMGDIPAATFQGKMEELPNSERIKIIETSYVHLVETTEIRGPTEEIISTLEMETATETSISTPEDKIEDAQENIPKEETATEETSIQSTLEKIQEDTRMKRSEEMKEEQQPAVTFQEMSTNVTKDAEIDETMNIVINPVDTMVVKKQEDTEMVNPPAAKQEDEEEAVTISESMVPEEESGPTTDDDLIDPEVGPVTTEVTIETTISMTTIQSDSGGAVAEGVDSHGVLIGVGSSVESSGLTITEIADGTVIVEQFEVERESAWGLSEPLITPPEEEIIEAIGDLCDAVDDTVDREEPPLDTESPVLVVTEDDAENGLLNDLQTSFDGKTQTTTGTQNSQQAAESSKGVVREDMEQLAPSDTVVVDMAKPLDLQDVDSLLPSQTETAAGTADIVAALVSPPLSTPENEQATDNSLAEDSAVQEGAGQGHQDGIAEAVEKVLPTEEQDFPLPSEVVSLEAHSVEVGAVDSTKSPPPFEADRVSISMSSPGAEEPVSIDQSATAVVEQVTTVDNIVNATEGAASDVLPPSAKGLGLGLEVDSSVLSSEARVMESAESRGVAPVLQTDMDGRGNEQLVDCALDGSAYVVVDGLEAGEALERNEKKRAREEEGDAVTEDEEKTPKAAKTAKEEISELNVVTAIDAKIGEDVQGEKKRSRDELEEVLAEPDVSIQTKVQKIGIIDDDTGSQSRKADTEEEADVEECEDMDDNEEVQEKSVNGAGQDSGAPRHKKRKIALFLGYSGAGYQGMQKNPGAITIEGELEEALYRAGAIAESNYGHPQKLDWRRAARTDKGVSAVGQVVSGCFFIDPPGFIERVNSHLPKQIRVYGYKRATASFNAKKLCDRRKYEYVLPVYAFDPTVHLDRETTRALAAAEMVDSLNENEAKATVTKISGSAGETEAHVAIESEMKETIMEEDTGIIAGPIGETVVNLPATNSVTPKSEGKEGNPSSSNGICAITEELTAIDNEMKETIMEVDTEILVGPIGETVVNLPMEAVNIVTPGIEGKEGNPSSSNEICDITEEVTTVAEIAQGNVAARVKVQTEETVLETKDATSSETLVDLSLEGKEALDEKASTAPLGVLVQTQEVSTEQTEVTATETLTDLSTDEKKEALDEKVKKSTYKFDESEFNRLNRILGGFEGHHNFHNFTARTKATDPSANRYIISFGVEDTFTIEGIEFVRCSVVGQSFMLHQIRKMIGLAVAIMRGTAPESILATALRRDTKINVPMAPELGLFLEECYYSSYNRRFKATHEEMSLSSFPAEVNEFKKEFIYPHIGSTEAQDSTFAMWLHSLNDRHYPDFVAAREAEKLVES